MNRNIVLNLVFIAIFILFLVLSLTIDFFFFIPIICFLPFSFSALKKNKTYLKDTPVLISSETDFKHKEIRYCQRCGGEIEPTAIYCYHCGEKLNNK
ncbi:MAG: hypothetical protein ACFFDF_13100 [Candidatus Odinarchaeota archaeon]